MKKFVVGVIVGAMFMVSGQAIAGSISKVGKKVQAEYTIKVDGETLDVMALAIDGQTTVPARAFANATGYDIGFVNKEVIMNKRTEVQPVEEETGMTIPGDSPGAPPEEEIEIEIEQEPGQEHEHTLESITALINEKEEYIRKLKPLYDRMIQDGASPDQLNDLKEKEAELENLKSIKAELEAKQ